MANMFHISTLCCWLALLQNHIQSHLQLLSATFYFTVKRRRHAIFKACSHQRLNLQHSPLCFLMLLQMFSRTMCWFIQYVFFAQTSVCFVVVTVFNLKCFTDSWGVFKRSLHPEDVWTEKVTKLNCSFVICKRRLTLNLIRFVRHGS